MQLLLDELVLNELSFESKQPHKLFLFRKSTFDYFTFFACCEHKLIKIAVKQGSFIFTSYFFVHQSCCLNAKLS